VEFTELRPFSLLNRHHYRHQKKVLLLIQRPLVFAVAARVATAELAARAS
jgi:hypothetical protein